MLKLRIISAVIGGPIFIALIWLGYVPFGLAIVVLSLIGLIEYYLPWPKKNIFPASILGVCFGLMFPVLVLIGYEKMILDLMAVLVACVLMWQIFTRRRARAGVDAGVTVLGSLYAGLLPSYLILIRMLPGGRGYMLATVTAVWACDITAYFVGRTLGRHRLAPDISPHKTVEGAIAGVVAAVLTGVVFAATGWLTWPKGLILGALIGIFAQLGDLVASMLKREVGIKDYGKAIPGHGGILDRFDGLFFAAPFIFFLFYLY